MNLENNLTLIREFLSFQDSNYTMKDGRENFAKLLENLRDNNSGLDTRIAFNNFLKKEPQKEDIDSFIQSTQEMMKVKEEIEANKLRHAQAFNRPPITNPENVNTFLQNRLAQPLAIPAKPPQNPQTDPRLPLVKPLDEGTINEIFGETLLKLHGQYQNNIWNKLALLLLHEKEVEEKCKCYNLTGLLKNKIMEYLENKFQNSRCNHLNKLMAFPWLKSNSIIENNEDPGKKENFPQLLMKISILKGDEPFSNKPLCEYAFYRLWAVFFGKDVKPAIPAQPPIAPPNIPSAMQPPRLPLLALDRNAINEFANHLIKKRIFNEETLNQYNDVQKIGLLLCKKSHFNKFLQENFGDRNGADRLINRLSFLEEMKSHHLNQTKMSKKDCREWLISKLKRRDRDLTCKDFESLNTLGQFLRNLPSINNALEKENPNTTALAILAKAFFGEDEEHPILPNQGVVQNPQFSIPFVKPPNPPMFPNLASVTPEQKLPSPIMVSGIGKGSLPEILDENMINQLTAYLLKKKKITQEQLDQLNNAQKIGLLFRNISSVKQFLTGKFPVKKGSTEQLLNTHPIIKEMMSCYVKKTTHTQKQLRDWLKEKGIMKNDKFTSKRQLGKCLMKLPKIERELQKEIGAKSNITNLSLIAIATAFFGKDEE